MFSLAGLRLNIIHFLTNHLAALCGLAWRVKGPKQLLLLNLYCYVIVLADDVLSFFFIPSAPCYLQ